jgi:hypothetical protein
MLIFEGLENLQLETENVHGRVEEEEQMELDDENVEVDRMNSKVNDGLEDFENVLGTMPKNRFHRKLL